MSASFAELLKESFVGQSLRPGNIVKGLVEEIGADYVVVNAGLKSEALVPVEQFYDESGELEIAVGDSVDVVVDAVEDGQGATRLSRDKAKRIEAWARLMSAHETRETINGIITGKVRGGFIVEVQAIRAFLPGSLVDVRPLRDTSHLEGKLLEFKVIKVDQKRNNVVVSRRAVVEAEGSADRDELLKTLEEGQEITGIVKNLTDYGAFVDLGGIDGLLHITDMSWRRVKRPSDIVTVGDEIQVRILKFDRERARVSLGIKQLGDDPWLGLDRRYPIKSRLFGKVSNITDYGCFVELEPGIEGLVHVSEMDWTNKNVHPNKIVQVGDDVEVMVLELDESRRRISLGLKQCAENPWLAFAGLHAKDDRVKGSIKSITDFGLFIGLDGEIDGLVHLSDISWDETGEEAVRRYKKGEEVEAVILTIDAERERISLGIKQLVTDQFSGYLEESGKGSLVTGTVSEVDADGAHIQLTEEIIGYLRAADIDNQERVKDATTRLSVGDEIEAKITGVDRKARVINLSIKAKDSQEEAEAIKQYVNTGKAEKSSGTLGDLLKDQLDK